MSLEGNAASTYELRGKLSGVFSNIIDNTLSIEGAGADAKATGDAIQRTNADLETHVGDKNNPHRVTAEQVGARPETWTPTALEVGARPNNWLPSIEDIGAAPAGYGLGTAGAWVTDLNAAINNGFYSWTDTALNKPFNYGNLLVLNRGDSRITQIGVDPNMVGHREMAVRHRNSDDTWSMWEYINPPMQLGVEYPTVERYRGKRVYTKAIDFGSMPNASVKSVNHNIANLGACISAVGTTSDGSTFGYYLPLYNSNAVNGQVGIYVSQGAIQVSATANWSSYKATIILKYTKTTG